MERNTQCGFSLLEMCIVLGIIAMVISGIVMSKSMIRESQIRAAIGEYDSYLKAIKEFQDKYRALPGDFGGNGTSGYSNAALATTLWGTDTGCPNTSYNTIAKIATCDGDANGHIGDSTTAAGLSNSQEWWRAWQHLSDAGFLQLSVTGANGSSTATYQANIGVNVPASKLSGAGWTLDYYLYPNNGINSNTSADLWMDQYGHLLNLGAFKSGDYTRGAVLLPKEAWQIDSKIDDGLPGTGKIRAWRTNVLNNPACISGDGAGNQSTATYNTNSASTQYACSLIFLLGF